MYILYKLYNAYFIHDTRYTSVTPTLSINLTEYFAYTLMLVYRYHTLFIELLFMLLTISFFNKFIFQQSFLK